MLKSPVPDNIALHPGAEIVVRNIIFQLTGANATAASDALGDVQQHAPPVIRVAIVG